MILLELAHEGAWYKKIGEPKAAVITPNRISAGSSSVRAMMSALMSNTAPASALAGSIWRCLGEFTGSATPSLACSTAAVYNADQRAWLLGDAPAAHHFQGKLADPFQARCGSQT